MKKDDEDSRSVKVVAMVEAAISGLLDMSADNWPELEPLPEPASSLIGELAAVPDGARDLALLLLAYCLVEGRPLNVVDPAAGDIPENGRLPGDRVASDLQTASLRAMGIQATSPLQNSTFRASYLAPQAKRKVIGSFVRWLSEDDRELEEVAACFEVLAQRIAATANRARPLPPLDHNRLTFPAVLELVDRLLAHQSGGAYEQYLFAAALESVLDEEGGGFRAVTKVLHAPDQAAGTAGDVEVRQGQNLIDVYELSANNWQEKAAQAAHALHTRAELRRAHIVAPGSPTGPEIVAGLKASKLPPGADAERLDIAVLDLRAEVASLLGRCSKHARRNAITTLYDYLRQFQPDAAIVDRLVELVEELGLTLNPA